MGRFGVFSLWTELLRGSIKFCMPNYSAKLGARTACFHNRAPVHPTI